MSPAVTTNLQGFLGRPIQKICPLAYHDEKQNHCAHFVSHALNIQYGVLCGDMEWKTRHQGATIKVHELFNNLIKRGPWEDRPKGESLLIFVTSAKNVTNNQMPFGDHNIPQKHVGIATNGGVYNYSNTLHRVVCDASVEIFHTKFKHWYHGGDISLYYGVIR